MLGLDELRSVSCSVLRLAPAETSVDGGVIICAPDRIVPRAPSRALLLALSVSEASEGNNWLAVMPAGSSWGSDRRALRPMAPPSSSDPEASAGGGEERFTVSRARVQAPLRALGPGVGAGWTSQEADAQRGAGSTRPSCFPWPGL